MCVWFGLIRLISPNGTFSTKKMVFIHGPKKTINHINVHRIIEMNRVDRMYATKNSRRNRQNRGMYVRGRDREFFVYAFSSFSVFFFNKFCKMLPSRRFSCELLSIDRPFVVRQKLKEKLQIQHDKNYIIWCMFTLS